MAHLSSDGQPFSPEDIKRLREALISLSLDCLEVAPVALNAKRLRAGHAQLSAGLERMQPGRYRTQPITFGSLAGFDAARIAAARLILRCASPAAFRRFSEPDLERLTLALVRTTLEALSEFTGSPIALQDVLEPVSVGLP
ncbi:hypothetical protein GCM10022631_07260 [Deinococcus rubellus]|uniref:hypothetical protein n=1 Tax=Deinococcus rubellus TaxID=1889240 RepID=UPI0031E79908